MWRILGWICVGLGLIGAALPLMPTVPFLLLALFCFEKGSPQLHRWLLEHKTFGPSLVQWREHRVISIKAKIIAIVGLSISLGYTLYFRPLNPWIKVLAAGTGVVVILFIGMQKNRPPKDREYK